MRKFRLTGLLILILLFSLACNLPRATPTVSPDLAFTAAAQTVEARMTELAAQSSPTPLPPTPTLPPLPTLPTPATNLASNAYSRHSDKYPTL